MTDSSSDEIHLPGGYIDEDGHFHDHVELATLDGVAEEALAAVPPGTCAARIVTLLLTHCLRRIGTIHRITPDVVRLLLVEDREYLVLRLRQKTLGPEMWISLACPHAGCCKGLEVKLMLDEIKFESRPIRSRRFQLDSDAQFQFRLPMGHDQELAASSGFSDPESLRDFLLARCLNRSQTEVIAIDNAVKRAIEAQMESLVPDVIPEMEAICPECGRCFTSRIDLCFLAIRELRLHSFRLEQEVHLFAWNYKWSERDILAMPRHKRERYVQIVQDELEQRSSYN
jgi:hypothetical protein